MKSMNIKQYILSYLQPQILEVIDSKINEKIIVQKFFGRNRIVVDGLTQSGEYVADLFGKALREVWRNKKNVAEVLILGFGAGSVGWEVNRYFPSANLTAIDIDEKMFNIGKRYFNLKRIQNLTCVVADAFVFCKRPSSKKYDLIIADLYVGYNVPTSLESADFINSILNISKPNGTFLINRLYFKDYRQKTDVFAKLLEKFFPQVKRQKILSNLMLFADR